MTTINNLTIEQMKEIVEGAPTWAIWWCVEKKKFLDFIPCSKCFVVDDLRTAIAEHDREFKVGDWVVFINPNMSKSVKEIKSLEGLTHVSFNFHPFHINLIRHATPEEIKAGHRLEAERHG